MSRLLPFAMVLMLFGTAACGGDDGGGSSSTGDGGGAGTGGKNDGGAGGKGGRSGSDGGPSDVDAGSDGGGGSSGSGGGGDKDGSVDKDGSATDAEILDGNLGVDVQPPDFDPCTDVQPTDDEVTATMQVGAMPTAVGGTITDGTYVLTSFDVYSPGTADGKVLRRLAKFAGNDMTVVYFDGSGPEQDNVGTFTTNGNMLTFSIDCPGEIEAMLVYSATATTFSLFDLDASTVATYTKQ